MSEFAPSANQLSGTGVPLGALPRPVDLPYDMPVGATFVWWTLTAPSKCIFLDGSALSREEYKELFALWGTAFGVGDGTRTFNVPNLKGRAPVAYDSSVADFNTVGKTGGTSTETLTSTQIPAHAHTLSSATISTASHTHTLTMNPHTHTATYLHRRLKFIEDSTGAEYVVDNADPQGGAQNHPIDVDYATPTGSISGGDHSHSLSALTLNNTGGGGSHNNLSPYIVCQWACRAKP